MNEHQAINRHNGFVIVRLPDRLDDPYHVSVLDQKSSRRIRYGGIDRMTWDFLWGSEKRTLPINVQAAQAHIIKSKNILGVDICDDLGAANELLAFANSNRPDYELVAIRSSVFDLIYGSVTLFSQNIHWLGFDCVSVGWWLLLREGIFLRPYAFVEWIEFLGPSGLFVHDNIVYNYVKAYEANAHLGLVEPIPTGIIYDNRQIDVGSLCVVEIGMLY